MNPPFSRLLFNLLFVSIFFFGACQEDSLVNDILVYENDFSGQDLTQIENGKLHVFNEDTVLGNYNNEEVLLQLEGLPRHNIVRVNIDLLVHDSWDGNLKGLGGPDKWYMKLDNMEIINTTFSNSICSYSYCLYQSYPDNYGRHYDPKTGAININLPGLCQYNSESNWTSLYKISKLVYHHGSNLEIILGDQLIQENAENPICDESWSLAKIEVSTLTQ
ncbi:hypothetical protein QWY93_07815 [Echinicola jeungdonensis]|uniref:hypothetical protein n=1 Tax=Echinicola jeungdonensis TaxID=709343 RepID=UPI0025B2B0E6|nr:hypothetical protein [Echinicola jeungdonensis]MDN3669231.1 hypothetical protein [Echinicola jeungdonensis]